MRSVISLVGTMAGSCFGTCCASCACQACTMACKGTAQGARVAYLALLAAGVVASLVLRFQLAPALLGWEAAELSKCDSEECAGNEAVYRVSGALCLFHLLLAAVCACPGGFSVSAHRGFWFVKLALVASVAVGSLWIPNAVFDAYASAARVASVLFVLYQSLLLIDFAYSWNARWVGLDEEEDAFKWRAGILGVCVALFACCFAGVGVMYAVRAPEGAEPCGFNNAVITVTLVAILAFTALGVSPVAPHGALLPSAIIAADCVYLCWSAISSVPRSECNPFSAAEGGGHESLHLVIGLAMAGVSIAWKANTAATSSHVLAAPETQSSTLLPLSIDGAQPTPVATSEVPPAEDSKEEDGEDGKDVPLEEDAAFFHVVMAVSCAYFGTLLTDWGTSSPAHGDIRHYDVSMASAWVKVATQWSIVLMYVWTLVAPAVFPDRDFD